MNAQGLSKISLYFIKDWFYGITIYCSDSNNIYKYNATMLTYLVSLKSFVPSQTIGQILSIHSDQFLTIKDDDKYVK